jgi:hypothetical protein
MKRTAIFLLSALFCAGIVWAAYQAVPPSATPLSKYVPASPLLYLEAKDFSTLLADWNFSPQKKQWIESSNYQVFSRSRLFLRLHGAGDQFAAAAGLPPDMNFLSQVAGTRSAVALYDIGNLQFLYITYLPSAKSMQTTLWQSRAKFKPRSAGGVNFYLRRDPESQKEVAFAVSGDYLLLATREDLLAGALQLMSGSQNRTVESEHWWSQSVAAAGAPGDLRMVLNLEKIVPSPYFRTYWVQQNITDLTQYSAAVSDLFRSDKQYREERVLLQKGPPATASSADELEAAANLVRLVPDSAGVYEATAHPSADSCLDLLETKLLAPHLGPLPPSQIAPQVQLISGETGAGADLETRIDQPPVQHPVTAQSTTALKELLDKAQLLASLQVQSTEREKAGVFVRIHSAVVLAAASDWNEANVKSALAEFVRPALTASQLGVTWQQKSGYHDSSYYEFDGLWPLVASIRGKYLLVSDDPNLIAAMLSNFNHKSDVTPAVFIAGFNHSRERANFARFSAVVDRPNLEQSNVPGMERQPQFFSENMASLSSTVAGVSSENIKVRIDGGKVLQTVTYEWSQ